MLVVAGGCWSWPPVEPVVGKGWGVMVVGKRIGPSVDETRAELVKQVQRRIRFVLLKKQGII